MPRPSPRSWLAVLALLVLTGVFYSRPGMLLGTSALTGLDYEQLHMRRITFAREALFGIRHTLPAWYPHEALGSPFWANLQSFPWIPTRLLLLPLDPSIAYAVGIAMAAALASIFTYLYGRQAGLTRTGAAASGGTFACAGYFASRVLAGHLPLLEAYPALPLLLWLVDRALATERWRRHRFDLGMLAFSSTCVVLAGHPQLPAYSIASALLYTVWRGRAWLRVRVMAAIMLGAGLAFAVWWPMLLLIARSTRVLRLAAPDNDIAMPYGRLLALIVPAIHGWAKPVKLADANPFTAYPDPAYFWDTAAYVGLLPLVAIAALSIRCAVQKRMPEARWAFLACLGTAALFGSLPVASPLLHLLPGTLLRSPARLLYLSTFGAAIALGVGVDTIRRTRWRAFLMLALPLHFLDLWGFTHWFIQEKPRITAASEFQAILERELGDSRIGEDRENLVPAWEDRWDDAGGFDSIFLARLQRGIAALSGDPADLNEQEMDASDYPIKALEATGVRFVITPQLRPDLELVSQVNHINLYRVAMPAPRAEFFVEAEFVAEQKIPELFASNPRKRLLLPREAKKYSGHAASSLPGSIAYSRPSSDEILLHSNSGEPGFVHVLEAYDPGWTATLDGAGVPVLPANGFEIAVPVPAGRHTVRLRYATPGWEMGASLSLLSLVALVVLIGSSGVPARAFWRSVSRRAT